MRLYPVVASNRKSFAGVKRVVVPMQSMSLKEIIRRFIKRESLPISQEGVYDDRYDVDLEKLAHEDLTVKAEMLEELKAKTKALDLEIKRQDAAKKDAMSKAAAAQRLKLLEELKATTAQTAVTP